MKKVLSIIVALVFVIAAIMLFAMGQIESGLLCIIISIMVQK